MTAPARVEIIGHRGASLDAPENTLASLHLAWAQGADAVEFDVWQTRDGHIVLFHDATLVRTAGAEGRVADHTLTELRLLDVGRWKSPAFAGERIATLAEALATVPAGKRALIEVKCGPEVVPELDRLLTASGLPPQQTPVISFSANVVAAVKQRRPDLPAYWVVDLEERPRAPEELLAGAKSVAADGLDLSASPEVLDATFAGKVLAAGLRLCVWTVDGVELAQQMLGAGVESLTTNRPGWLRGQLACGAST
ncbi:glycerophosphodiester phosphodiesterase [Gemmata sp.]|uniref:glycerophosphodiester phosphodiesterase n=1 Tax=Gemmata sp. TaxID=1914242 RepID=UPI003F6FE6BD